MDTDVQTDALEECVVSSDINTMRLDVWLANFLEERAVTRAKVQDIIKSGLVLVDGQVCRKPSFKVGPGMRVQFQIPDVGCALTPQHGELEVMYEDEDIAIINKPPYLTVHPAPSCPEGTLAHRLIERYPALMSLDSVRPGIVHRLDKDTSGLLAVALNERSRLTLSAAFADRKVSKTYLALVLGVPAHKEEIITAPIGRDPEHKTRMTVIHKGGRDAISRYRVVWSDPAQRVSLLEVAIETGRTHQIRVHLDHIGHPILGDAVYGRVKLAPFMRELGRMARLFPRQMLHAWRLNVSHPTTGQNMAMVASLPKDFVRALLFLEQTRQRVVVVGPAGCGKSAFLSCITKKGWNVFNSDAVVAETYGPDGDGTYLLSKRYGSRFVCESGVDKKALMQALLQDDSLRREIMDMIHPLVDVRLKAFWASTAKQRAGFAEIPLFFEIGWHNKDKADVVVGVFCSSEQRVQRLAGRKWDATMAATVDSWQWDPQKKRDFCGEIIENDGSMEQLEERVEQLLISLRRRRVACVVEFLQKFVADGYIGKDSGIKLLAEG